MEANSEAVNYLTSTQGGLISNTRIMDLPLAGRNMISLVTMAPGVVGLGTVTGGSPGSGVELIAFRLTL